jgi:hypothetical protein
MNNSQEITRIDVDFVTMLNSMVIRYRWNTDASDQWRKGADRMTARKTWDHKEYQFSALPEYVRERARHELNRLLARTKSKVTHDAVIMNISLADKQFVADVLTKLY